jgi:ankyrin repeat protein
MGLNEELLKVSELGKSDKVLALLENGADVNSHEGGEKIPGYVLNNVDDPKQLQTMGYSLNRTPLVWALIHQDWDLACKLLEAGADPNLVSNLGEQPMSLAAAGNAVEVLEALLERKAKPDKAGRQRQTPLMEAAETGALEAVQWLVKHKAKMERKNGNKETPLVIACREARADVADFLVEAGAQVDVEGDFGTPLTAAAGAIKRVPMVDGQPQFISVQWTDDGVFTFEPAPVADVLRIVKRLLEAGADPNLGTQKPLAEAAFKGNPAVVEELLQAGADPDHRSALGQTALEIAQLMNRSENVAILAKVTNAAPAPKPEATEFKAQYAPIPDLSKRLKTKSFLHLLAGLKTRCESSAEERANHVEFAVTSTTVRTERLQELALENDAFLCECTGSLEQPKRIAVFPSPRWQDALAVFQTNGINCDVASQDIIDWLEECEKEQPFRILTVSHDLVGGEFLSKVTKPLKLARRIYDFCPDTVDQGFGEVDELAEDLKVNGKFLFWWD